MIHEAAHTSLDGHMYNTSSWNSAVIEDGNKFISDYARDNPVREDIAESFLVWFAIQYAPDHFTQDEINEWYYYLGNRFAEFADEVCIPG